ncbi:MAG: phosphatase PAP2 family protein [Desulfurococcales archaeon]|nr:phosphatase PAP2 family protein [Desulfurococcales archaeon]
MAAASVLLLLGVAAVTDSATLWEALTFLGEEYLYVFLSIASIIFLNPDWGVLLLYSVVLSGSVDVALKYALNLPRPPKSLWRVQAEGPGFPSGHTEVSSGFWTQASLLTRSKWVSALSAAVIASVAVSRVALMVHYPRDVVGGAVIGIALSAGLFLTWRYLPLKGWVSVAAITSAIASAAGAYTSGTPVTYKLLGVSLGAWTYVVFRDEVREVMKRSLKIKVYAFLASSALTALLLGFSKPLEAFLGVPAGLTLSYFFIPPAIYALTGYVSGRCFTPSQREGV